MSNHPCLVSFQLTFFARQGQWRTARNAFPLISILSLFGRDTAKLLQPRFLGTNSNIYVDAARRKRKAPIMAKMTIIIKDLSFGAKKKECSGWSNCCKQTTVEKVNAAQYCTAFQDDADNKSSIMCANICTFFESTESGKYQSMFVGEQYGTCFGWIPRATRRFYTFSVPVALTAMVQNNRSKFNQTTGAHASGRRPSPQRMHWGAICRRLFKNRDPRALSCQT